MTTFARKSSLVINAFINTFKYDLNRESDRLATFIDGGYSNEFVKAEDLALFGFYFYKRPDTVKCAYCGVLIEDFEDGDEALGGHLKFSPNCPLLEKKRATRNIPLDENIFKQRAPPVSNYDECGSENLNHHKFQYPQFRLPHRRMETFETWPVGIEQKPNELVEAGFFYSGRSDLVVCFACGLYLNQWENGDIPLVEHKKLAPTECEVIMAERTKMLEDLDLLVT